MPVLLRTSSNLPNPQEYDVWVATTGTTVPLDPGRKLLGLARELEAAFNECRETWWRLGYQLGQTPTAEIAHAPTGGAYGSDFGLMLAWSRLAERMVEDPRSCLIICDDPWLFRHLAGQIDLQAGSFPALWGRLTMCRLRGVLARVAVAIRVAFATIRLRAHRAVFSKGDATLLVYGHPESTAEGFDCYFGSLMNDLPKIKRLLHTDCPVGRAKELAFDNRTASLHAWGRFTFAARLATTLWRPSPKHLNGPFGWLVRRAAEKENSGGGPAMNRWQLHCQEAWLSAARPSCLAWPWENHAWERALCRVARMYGIRTIGYQHSVIGPHQLNYSTATNPDGVESIPDLVVANGPAYRAQMQEWGVPDDRLVVGGAFRYRLAGGPSHDPSGPLFVPLSPVRGISNTLLSVAAAIARKGQKILVKPHPMYPIEVPNIIGLEVTTTPLRNQRGLAGVMYSTGTSGLEALLAGLPTFRLLPEDYIAINILPNAVTVLEVTLDDAVETVTETLARGCAMASLDWQSVLKPPDINLWKKVLCAGSKTHAG